MTYRESRHKACSELLPDPGTTILIGQPKSGKGFSAVWLDDGGKLQTIGIAPVGDHWEAKVKYEGKSYLITVDVRPDSNGRPAIGGMVKPAAAGKAAPSVRKPGGKEDTQGSWGAEANPGGGKG